MNEERLEAVYRCPLTACERLFIARYKQYSQGKTFWNYVDSAPVTWEPPTVLPEISSVSPSFVEIFKQASQAEAMSLDQIAGVGYRKALEFLIKDYCIQQHPQDQDEIKKTFLAPCIQKWVTDFNVKICAERAAWLGNDETHYVRKWETKDTNDLKALIDLTCTWIHSSVLTKKYLDGMQKA